MNPTTTNETIDLTPAAREAHKGWPQVLGWLKGYLE
jgi:hypothetical protein